MIKKVQRCAHIRVTIHRTYENVFKVNFNFSPSMTWCNNFCKEENRVKLHQLNFHCDIFFLSDQMTYKLTSRSSLVGLSSWLKSMMKISSRLHNFVIIPVSIRILLSDYNILKTIRFESQRFEAMLPRAVSFSLMLLLVSAFLSFTIKEVVQTSSRLPNF